MQTHSSPRLRFHAACALVVGVLAIIASPAGALAQSDATTPSSADARSNDGGCSDCPLPAAARRQPGRDSTFDVHFRGDRPPIRRVTSVRRETMRSRGRLVQALAIQYLADGTCRDTLVPVDEVERLGTAGVGLEGQTISIPLLPAREFYRDDLATAAAEGFVEIGGGLRFAGSDTSSREVGFASIAPLAQIDVGRRIATWLDIAVGLGVEIDRSRLRLPLRASVRLLPFGTVQVEPYFRYSDPCRFGMPGESPATPGGSFTEVPSTAHVDSTVYFTSDSRTQRDAFRPFFYLEGGIILNGSFDGASATPSENPEEYGQYLGGAGAGLPLFDLLVVSLGYRYTRMNVRTPCEACGDRFVVNTSVAHSAVASLAFTFDF